MIILSLSECGLKVFAGRFLLDDDSSRRDVSVDEFDVLDLDSFFELDVLFWVNDSEHVADEREPEGLSVAFLVEQDVPLQKTYKKLLRFL